MNGESIMDMFSKQVAKVFKTEKAFGQAKFLLFLMIGLAFWIFLLAILFQVNQAILVLVLVLHMYFVTSMRYPGESGSR